MTMAVELKNELSQFLLEEAVVHIIEASVKLKCSVLTRSKALLIYHHFKRCVHETKYKPLLVAAACLSLSIKNNEEPVEYDAIILVFMNIFEPGSCPSTQDEKFKENKKSVTLMSYLVLRMVEFSITYKLAHEFLPYFMYEFHSEMSSHAGWEVFVETCMRITSDFYFSNKCLNYKPEEIASTVIQVSLYLFGIEITNECYLKEKVQALNDCEESKRQDIIEDIFTICDVGPIAESLLKKSPEENSH